MGCGVVEGEVCSQLLVGIDVFSVLMGKKTLKNSRAIEFLLCWCMKGVVGCGRSGLMVVGEHVGELIGFIVNWIARCDSRTLFIHPNVASRSSAQMDEWRAVGDGDSGRCQSGQSVGGVC